MKIFNKKSILLGAALCCLGSMSAANYAWPEKFEGVMLQGFYWDSFKGTDNTKWSTLTNQSDELSKYFKLIWVPNGAKCSNSQSMGYDPVYWFSNYNGAFGTETQLRNMIKTFKEKGTGIIADVVINHRCGKSNWTDFPKEEWNGQTYQLGPQHICSSDEVRNESGQAKPTGAPDTGEDFGSARDLDHTNAEVQRNCKAYCQFLIQDMGYAGFRYDMAKGYSGYYNKLYNEASHPTYSVGEYFDGNYDKVKDWIEATGRQSAAFDFPCKYAMNEAFASNDMTKLSWKANGTTDQPAGMIHFGYAQYAVTFVDNHDTYRDGSKFTGNVLAANAFILCSPGTPCVFWPHYTANKAAIQKLIEIRNAVGVHNQSSVKVLQLSRDCYMAEVYGSKGTLVVKIGGAMVSPDGYSNSDIKASGDGYCVWTKASVGGNTNPDTPSGESFKVYYDNSATKWATPYIHYWGATESAWPGVAMTKEKDNVWSYTVPAGTTGILFNAGDGDATKTDDFVAIANHLYTNTGDQGVYNGAQGGGNDTPTGEEFAVYFDNSASNWATPYIYYWGNTTPEWPGVPMTKVKDNVWSYTVPAGTTGILFNAGDGDATKTDDFVAVANHIYTTAGDNGVYNGGQGGGNDTPTGEEFAVYFDNGTSNWATPYIYYWGNTTPEWPGVPMTKVKDNVWSYTVPAGTTGILFNAGDGDATKTEDFVAVANHIYTTAGDNGVYNGGQGGGNDTPTGEEFAVYFDNGTSNWATPYIYYWGNTTPEWPGVPMTKVKDNVWSYTVPAGTTGILFNAGDGDATKTEDFVAVANHLYTTAGDQGIYSGAGGDDPVRPSTYPDTLYLVGNIEGHEWTSAEGIAQTTKSDGIYTWNNITFTDAGNGYAYFTFLTALDAVNGEWDGANQSDRYGAPAKDTPITIGEPSSIVLYAVNVSAMGAESWMVTPGTYNIVANLKEMKVTVNMASSGVEMIDGADETPVYFNMQGVKVENPEAGLYIVVRGKKVTKEIVK